MNKELDSYKICFIMCTNNIQYEKEAIVYINSLNVPDGFKIEIISVKEANSMASGYNEAMNISDAKYKVYMHQDVFIINKNFIFDVLDVFKDEKIGLLGTIGIVTMPDSAMMWAENRVGNVKTICTNSVYELCSQDENQEHIQVEAVDGLLMVTQYDLKWREDIFTGWDFYDASQSQEFLQNGYKVIVPYMETAWCIHDDGILNLKDYNMYRERFLKEYKNG